MQTLDVLRRHPILIGALGGAVLGVLIGIFLPIRAPAPSRATELSWRLPTLAQTQAYSDETAGRVRGASFWGAAATGSDRSARQTAWTLQAVMLRPMPSIAITHGGAKGVEWVRMRGKLPDGSMLVGVNKDAAWTERDGCRSVRKLYQGESHAKDDRCVNPDGSQPQQTPAATNSGSLNQRKKNSP